MLKFLTHKLRTHSLNEDQPHQDKADDDHDSGTESDDEQGDADDPDPDSSSEQSPCSPLLPEFAPLRSAFFECQHPNEAVAANGILLPMESEAERPGGPSVSPPPPPLPSLPLPPPGVSGAGVSGAGAGASVAALTACSPYFLDSALPSDSDHNYDHHSSEEELEVINSCPAAAAPAGSSDSPPESASSGGRLPPGGGARPASGSGALLVTVRSGSVTVPEKRKWSQVTHQTAPLVLSAELSSSSSDDEVQGLLADMATPVRFRTWPPLEAHRPGRSLSPPPKLFHYAAAGDADAAPANASAPCGLAQATADASPRKRHRHTPRASHIQRPCLDFEKMQQLKARAVSAWRHGGDHGGELSVFCW